MKKLIYSLLTLLFFFSFGSSLFGQETKYKVEYNIEHNLYDYPDNDTNDDDYSDLRIRFFTSGIDIYNENLRFPDDENGLITVFDDVITTPAPETQLRYFYDTECPENNFQPFNNTFGLFDGCRENLLDTALRNWSPCVNITENYGRIVQLPSVLSDLNDDTTLQDCEPYTIEVAAACQAAQLSYALDYRVRDPLGSIIDQGELSSYSLKLSSFTFDLSDITNESPSNLGIIDLIVRYVENPSTPSHSATLALTPRACSIELRDTDPIQIVDASCNSANDGSITLNFKNDVETNFGMRYFIFQGDYTDFTGVVETVDGTTFPNQVFDEVLFSPTSPSGSLVANGDGTYRGTYSQLDGTNTNPNPPPGEENQQNYYVIYQEVDYNSDPVIVKSGELIEQTFTIRQPAEISISIPANNITQPLCSGDLGEVTLVGAGGGFDPNPNSATLEYGIQGINDSWQSSPTFIDLQAGDYTFLARTSTTCISNASQLVTIDPVPTFEFDTTNTRIGQAPSPGGSDGSIEVALNGGVSNITLQIYNDAANPALVQSTLLTGNDRDHIFTGLPAGIYYLRAIDVNPCTITSVDTYELQSAPIPILQEPVPTDPFCNNGNDGSVSMVITNPVSPYEYRILDNGGSQVSTGNGAASPSAPVTITANNLSDGSYTIEVIYNSGDFNVAATIATETFTLANPNELIISLVDVVGLDCNGTTNGYIEISISETGPLLQYSYRNLGTWIDLDPSLRIPITQAGTYNDIKFRTRRTVSDFIGCESTNELDNIIVPDGITVTENVPLHQNVTTNGGNDGAIFIDVSGGNNGLAPNYTFEWTGVLLNGGGPYMSNTQNIQNLLAGNYTVRVIDEKLCEEILGPIQITEPGPLSLQAPTGTPSCNGSSTGSVTVEAQGTGTIRFDFFEGSPTNIIFTTTTLERTVSALNLPAGDYGVTITELDSGNDLTTAVADYFTINELAAISATVTPTDATCALPNSGSITITATIGGSNSGFTYGIDDGFPPQTASTFTGLTPRDYIVTITDDQGCDYTETVTVGAGELPIVDIDNSGPTSPSTIGGNDGTIVLNFTNTDSSGYTYLWTGPGVTGDTTQNLTGLIAGNYSVVITSSPGCSITENFTVTDPAPQDIIPNVTNIDCKGDATGTIDVTIVGEVPISYQWTFADDSAITISNGTTSEDISGLIAGTYVLTITYTDTSTFRSDDIEITEPTDEITAEIPASTNVICNGGNDGSITITASGGTGALMYSLDGATPQASNVFSNLQSGSFVVTVIDGNGCSLPLPTIEITQPDPVTFIDNQTIIQPVSTNGGSDGSITAVVKGGSMPYFYEWSTNGSIIPGETSNILSGLTQGTYTLRVSNTNAFVTDGCFIERVFTMPEPGPLTISNIVSVNVDCRGNASGSIGTTVTGEGTITYAWTLDGGAPIPVSNGTDGPNIAGIAAGVYILTVTDDNETISSNPITITEPSEILVVSNIGSSDVTCFNGADGTITITATGGTAPYEYSIDDGTSYQNQNTFANVSTGSYTIRVRDFNGCTFLEPGTTFINQPQELVVTVTDQQSLSGAGASDGAITVVVTGGTGVLTYDWAGPGTFDRTSPSISGLVAGEYTVTVTDALGCTLISDPITIAEPGVLSVTSNQTVFLSCNGDDFGEIEAFPNGGVSPYTYQWFQVVGGNNNELTEDTNILADLTAGTYFVRITDANSISADGNPVVISEPSQIEITLDSKIDVLCASEETGALNISVTGGNPPYSYVWSSGQSAPNILNIPAGTYTVEVADTNLCFSEATFEVIAPTNALQITNASLTNVSSYQGSDGSISLDISGGASPYTINWTSLSDNTSAGNQATIASLSADSYQVLITDANGCLVTETYEISQPDIVEDTLIPPTCAGKSNGSISVLVNEGNGSFTYVWSTGETTNSISNLAAGTYSVTITGFGDGPLTRNYQLEDPLPLEVDLGEDRILCADQILELDASVDDETASYLWSSDTGFTSTLPNVTLTESGNYSVVVTSQTGCTVVGTVLVDISTNEIDAEFAMSSQVFVGEDVVAVDISFPLPESIVWEIPNGATVVTQNSDEVVLVFETEGEYEIGITTTRGNCVASKTKKVLVVNKDPLTEEDKTQAEKVVEDFIVYPNPTTGKFTADVSLTERGNITVKVFNFANNAMMASERGNGDTSYRIPFDISGMPSGVYAVVLETPYGTSLRKIVVR